ncbi:MAG: hypothetical protein R3275_03925 [Saprospiraceae bacterium]|nr:hypothetical protein [Saprospiraceae bacterium]
MKYWMLLLSLAVILGCAEGEKEKEAVEESKTETERSEPLPEGLRNKRGYPIGTVEQAEQLMAGAQAKRREIARRNADFIKKPQYADLIKFSSEKMEVIRPKMDRYDSITNKIITGERVDFLSDRDMGKIEYRQQSLLDALIDSLSYLNSQLDQVLNETDTILIKMK